MENKTPIETWKDIPSYEGKYQCSDFGNIKSLNYNKTKREQLLKPSIDKDGYLRVVLCKEGKTKTFKVQVLIAMAFNGYIPDGTHNIVVDHDDNDKLNNRADNIKLRTNRENTSKDRKGGTSKYIGVSWYKRYNKWRAQIFVNGKIKCLGYFENPLYASNAYQNALNNLINSK